MRAMSLPIYSANDILSDCISGIDDEQLTANFNKIINALVLYAGNYDNLAQSSQLYTLPPNLEDNDTIVTGELTKSDLKKLYSQYMVGQGKPARYYYDRLIAAAPGGKCPYCGFGHATTLDHYIPKSRYPEASVHPSNLVPSCKDCNTGKLSSYVTIEGKQVIHPYFDHNSLINTQWLFASVAQTSPAASIVFFPNPPSNWPVALKQRVHSHFFDFNLGTRYAVEAAEELSSLNPTVERFGKYGPHEVQAHLQDKANDEYSKFKNSWKTAMYQALATNVWYIQGGFAQK